MSMQRAHSYHVRYGRLQVTCVQSCIEVDLPGISNAGTSDEAPVELDLLGSMGVAVVTNASGSCNQLKVDEQAVTELIAGTRQLAQLVQPADVVDRDTLLRKMGHAGLAPDVPVRVLLKRAWEENVMPPE